MTETHYVLDSGWEKERERLDALGMTFNPGTERLLTRIGVREGWHCLEVGGGTGTTASWLCDRVGKSGRVVATDLDTRFLDALKHDNLEVRKHDIVADALEASAFDVVHTRLLLEHLGDRAGAVRKMVGALKPGGWLLAEDFDLLTASSWEPHSDLLQKVMVGLTTLMTAAGFDPRFGLKLGGVLTEAGLEVVQGEGRSGYSPSGSPQLEALALMLEQFRQPLSGGGLLSESEIDQAQLESRTPGRWGHSPLMIAAWGRKPA